MPCWLPGLVLWVALCVRLGQAIIAEDCHGCAPMTFSNIGTLLDVARRPIQTSGYPCGSLDHSPPNDGESIRGEMDWVNWDLGQRPPLNMAVSIWWETWYTRYYLGRYPFGY